MQSTEIRYFVGLDLGQRADPAAMAVCERQLVTGDFDHVYRAQRKRYQLGVRALERFHLGTSYLKVADRVRDVVEYLSQTGGVRVALDATGVGRPVVDMLEERGMAARLLPVIVTGGHNESYNKGSYSVPKMDLIDALRLAIDRGGIEFAAGMPQTKLLLEEFAAMRDRRTQDGGREIGARGKDHDDLVFAVMLGCWAARKTFPRDHKGRDVYMMWHV